MFGKVVRSLCRDRRGLGLVAGAIGVLAGVERLLSPPVEQVRAATATKIEAPISAAFLKPRLKISQTRSELGYVYWVLREHSPNPSYALFDTWREAMDEAIRRVNAASKLQVNSALVFA
jgi:hypothetical protein